VTPTRAVVVRSKSPRWKRAFDVIVACALLFVLAPIFGAAALAIAVESGRPVFFRQTRTGVSGREFRIAKFRTLRTEAPPNISAWLYRLNEAASPLFKIEPDPRATRVGQFLRRSALDELPQLWNVVRGEMSLVGPRPLVPEEAAGLPLWAAAIRSQARPGITGVWQITRDRHRRLELLTEADAWYAGHQTLLTDLRILALTISPLRRDLQPWTTAL
jgi:lipopolysaccharide/colanic/teichoic acid biosynthesis glycosyltransferase